jgi:putative tricarboxylic transport membrane protein
MAPLVLGVVLGDMMEQNLRRALSITNGELSILVQSNISKGLWLVSLAIVVVPPVLRYIKKKRRLAAQAG